MVYRREIMQVPRIEVGTAVTLYLHLRVHQPSMNENIIRYIEHAI